MTLQVIGTGFGRTGTRSLKDALEKLIGGRCYHMSEVFGLPAAPQQWIEAAEGRPNWEAIFAGFNATVDWPSTTYWRELAAAYPKAKIIHTERPAQEWFESAEQTIFQRLGSGGPTLEWTEMVRRVILPTFEGRLHDRDAAIAAYERHNREVRSAIPAERLLVYRLSEGWRPLADFLGVSAPDEPMIHINTREQFNAAHRG